MANQFIITPELFSLLNSFLLFYSILSITAQNSFSPSELKGQIFFSKLQQEIPGLKVPTFLSKCLSPLRLIP